MQDKLEEVENLDYLHDTRQQFPKVKDLSSRLKTKLVQDPLVLDREGNTLQEKNVLRLVSPRRENRSRLIQRKKLQNNAISTK